MQISINIYQDSNPKDPVWVRSILLLLKGTLEELDSAEDTSVVEIGDISVKVNDNTREWDEESVIQEASNCAVYAQWKDLMEIVLTNLEKISDGRKDRYESNMEQLRQIDNEVRELLGQEKAHDFISNYIWIPF